MCLAPSIIDLKSDDPAPSDHTLCENKFRSSFFTFDEKTVKNDEPTPLPSQINCSALKIELDGDSLADTFHLSVRNRPC